MSDFKIQLPELKKREKADSQADAKRVDTLGDQHGFVDRSPKAKRGRDPSPRTKQIHAWVLPEIFEEIWKEHKKSGKQQGVLIEEAWEVYKANKG